jgi:hypothetical protein
LKKVKIVPLLCEKELRIKLEHLGHDDWELVCIDHDLHGEAYAIVKKRSNVLMVSPSNCIMAVDNNPIV